MAHHTPEDEKARWLDHSRNVDKIVWALVASCAVLLASDILADRYGPFAVEHTFGFYAIFGFVASLVVVLVTRMLRPLVARREDYYDG
jgi:hypothetical protein